MTHSTHPIGGLATHCHHHGSVTVLHGPGDILWVGSPRQVPRGSLCPAVGGSPGRAVPACPGSRVPVAVPADARLPVGSSPEPELEAHVAGAVRALQEELRRVRERLSRLETLGAAQVRPGTELGSAPGPATRLAPCGDTPALGGDKSWRGRGWWCPGLPLAATAPLISLPHLLLLPPHSYFPLSFLLPPSPSLPPLSLCPLIPVFPSFLLPLSFPLPPSFPLPLHSCFPLIPSSPRIPTAPSYPFPSSFLFPLSFLFPPSFPLPFHCCFPLIPIALLTPTTPLIPSVPLIPSAPLFPQPLGSWPSCTL